MTSEILTHIVGGSFGLASGAIALISRKGGPVHRGAGHVFLVSMSVMALSGIYLAAIQAVYITVLAGALTFYLVASSWLTVRQNPHNFRVANKTAFILGLCVALYGVGLSWRAANGVTDNLGEYSVPAAIYFVFTGIAVLAVSTDVRVFVSSRIARKQRILRHLWRMSAPLYIAASSFFTGQQQVFPESLQGTAFLSIPEYAVLIIMVFWLVKVWFTWSFDD